MAADFVDNKSMFSRLLYVFEVIGHSFLDVSQFSSVVRLFVINESSKQKRLGDCESQICEVSSADEDQRFVCEATSLAYLNPYFLRSCKEKFEEFRDFSTNRGVPMSTVSISNRTVCRRCSGPLCVEGKTHVIVVYHADFGSYLGSRVTKVCRKCKVYEHYGHYTHKCERYYDESLVELDYFMSSEETAFHMSLLKQYSSLLVVGALPFSTFAESYNRRFGYEVIGERTGFKRKKRPQNKSGNIPAIMTGVLLNLVVNMIFFAGHLQIVRI